MAKVALKLEQKLKISQLQKLTIQLMTLHGQDLQEYLQAQVTENPLLDIRYPDVRSGSGPMKDERPIGNLRSRGESLEEMLMKELRQQDVPKPVLLAAGLVIQSLDEKGFFTGSLEDLGQSCHLSRRDMEEGLQLVQSFEPPGIGARSIQEALLIQARRHDGTPPGTERLLQEHYDDFIHGRWQRIEKALKLGAHELDSIRHFLKGLALQPASSACEQTNYVRPDVELVCQDGTVSVRSLEELPEVFFRDDLYALYDGAGDGAAKAFIRKARRGFLDLQTALAWRWQSVVAVMECIARHQENFFLHGHSLRPLSQLDIAAHTGLSTATVSRVCRNRYVLFASKTYAVQDFLAQSYRCSSHEEGCISDKAIMEKISSFIDKEDAAHPWSDQEIAEYLLEEQIQIARRTVAKFRFRMNIPNSCMRKRIKKRRLYP